MLVSQVGQRVKQCDSGQPTGHSALAHGSSFASGSNLHGPPWSTGKMHGVRVTYVSPLPWMKPGHAFASDSAAARPSNSAMT